MSEPDQSGMFEPLPLARSPLRARVDAASSDPESGTPERWFEPPAVDPNDPDDTFEPPADDRADGVGSRLRLFGALAIVSLVSAVLASGGTYFAMSAAGMLRPTAAPANGSLVSVESDTSTVIAAVKKVDRAVVQILANDGNGSSNVGSGMIFDVRGWVLTNKHVVAGMKSLTVRLADDRRVAATIYGLDTLSDLAIIKLQGATDIWAVELGNSAGLQIGQLAIAIGSPLGLAYPNSVSAGIVSALGRDISVGDGTSATPIGLHGLIQTDAAINTGNSGGPLVDASGMVVGVTTVEATAAKGIGFAIPIDIAKPIMQQALAGEPLARPYLGVAYEAIDKGLAADNHLDLDHGAWIHSEDSLGKTIPAVVSGSPADKAGILDEDIIVSIEGVDIDGLHRLEDLLVQFPPGRIITLVVHRKGGTVTLNVTLGTRPDKLS